jgi:hypothetical protein
MADRLRFFLLKLLFLGYAKIDYLSDWIYALVRGSLLCVALNCRFPTFCRSNPYALFDA